MLKYSSHRNRGHDSGADYALGPCRISSLAHDQICAFENRVGRRPPPRSGTGSRVRARAQFHDGSRKAIRPTIVDGAMTLM